MIKSKFRFYKSIIRKNSFVKKIENNTLVKHFCPKEDAYTKAKYNLKRLSIDTSVEMMIFYKFCIILFSFIFMLSLDQYYINQKRMDIIYGINSTSTNTVISFQDNAKESDKYQIILSELVARHKSIRGFLSENNLNNLYNEVKKIQHELMIEDPSNEITKQVLENIIILKEIKIKFNNVIIIFLAAILMSYVLDLYIEIKLKILDTKIESEINLIEMLTFTLINNNNISVEQILKKQRSYSKIIRGYYDKCLRVYPFDNEKAINDLKKDINNEEFNKFMLIIGKNLITDKDTNSKLLKAHRSLGNEIMQEKNKKKDNNKSLIFTLISLPVIFMANVILLAPILSYVNSMLNK